MGPVKPANQARHQSSPPRPVKPVPVAPSSVAKAKSDGSYDYSYSDSGEEAEAAKQKVAVAEKKTSKDEINASTVARTTTAKRLPAPTKPVKTVTKKVSTA